MRPRRSAPAAARAAAALLAALALSACAGQDAVDVDQAVSPQLKTVADGPTGVFAVDQRPDAPEVAGTTLDGEELDVDDLRGQVVVLNFWGSWCAPCRAEAANLVAVAERYADQGVQFVGVNVKDKPSAARAFERTQGVPYPSIHDQPGVLLTRFREITPQTFPTTLVIDRQGRVAARFIGGVTETELDLPVQVIARERA